MGESLSERLNDYFAIKGHKYLIAITILEILYFLVYTLVFVYYSKELNLFDISQQSIFKWAFILVLMISITYFLWNSVSFCL